MRTTLMDVCRFYFKIFLVRDILINIFIIIPLSLLHILNI